MNFDNKSMIISGGDLNTSLPLEAEVVHNGDVGGISVLNNNQLSFTKEFNKMVDEIIKLSVS